MKKLITKSRTKHFGNSGIVPYDPYKWSTHAPFNPGWTKNRPRKVQSNVLSFPVEPDIISYPDFRIVSNI